MVAYRLAPGACALALVAAMALAPPVVGAELRLMNADNVTAASPCIGNPVTPLCAAETAAACAIAGHKPYCNAVGRYFDPIFDSAQTGYIMLWQNRYEYLGEKALTDADIPAFARDRGKKSWQRGDVALRLWWQGCPPDDECFKAVRANPDRTVRKQCLTFANCRREALPQTYILRRQGDRWLFVDTNYDDVLPSSFWSRN